MRAIFHNELPSWKVDQVVFEFPQPNRGFLVDLDH